MGIRCCRCAACAGLPGCCCCQSWLRAPTAQAALKNLRSRRRKARRTASRSAGASPASLARAWPLHVSDAVAGRRWPRARRHRPHRKKNEVTGVTAFPGRSAGAARRSGSWYAPTARKLLADRRNEFARRIRTWAGVSGTYAQNHRDDRGCGQRAMCGRRLGPGHESSDHGQA